MIRWLLSALCASYFILLLIFNLIFVTLTHGRKNTCSALEGLTNVICPVITSNSFITRCLFWPLGIVIACICVYMCVRVRVNLKLVSWITCHPLKLELPNLDKKCKTSWLRSVQFWWLIDLDLQLKFELKLKIYPILLLSMPCHKSAPTVKSLI